MKVYKKKLKSGLRILTVPMKDSLTTTVMVLVEAGSKYENKENNGISHFLEHMCFKGTKKRPSALQISHELDNLGAQSNAFTGHEFTGYYAKAHYKKTNKMIDVISDLYLNPTLPREEMEREKGVIIEEINMYEDLPMQKVHELFQQLLHQDTPAGRSILGPVSNIKKMKIEDFKDYREKHYVGSATTIIVAGKIDSKKVIKEIEEKFKDVSTKKHYKKEKVTEQQKKPQLLIENKKSDQSHLILGFRTIGLNKNKKQLLTLKVLAGILGAGMSSRLFQKLREDLGVCYYVRASQNSYTDHGDFTISAGVDNKRVIEVIKVILEELNTIKTELITAKELNKTKTYLAGNLFLNLESSDSYAEYYGLQEILRQDLTKPQEKNSELKKITSLDIKKMAQKFFVNENLNLSLIGPFSEKDKQKIKKILKF